MASLTQEEIDTKVQGCYAIEDNGQAMDCLTKLIKDVAEMPGVCAPRFALFTHEGCPFCAEEKETHKNHLASGAMQEVNMDSPEGAKVAEELGVEYAPAIVLLDCQNRAIDFPETAPVEAASHEESV